MLIGLRQHILQFSHRQGGAYPGHHILTLGVQKELTVEFLGPGGGVAGESDSRPRTLPQVAENHHLHVDGSTQGFGNLVHAPVGLGALVVPGAEYGVSGQAQLVLGVLGERLAGSLLDQLLVKADDFPQGFGIKVSVRLGPDLFLDVVEQVVEFLLLDAEHHVAEHLDEAPVAIAGKAQVPAALGQAFH